MEKAVVQMLVKIKKNVLVKQGALKQSDEIFSKAKPSTIKGSNEPTRE